MQGKSLGILTMVVPNTWVVMRFLWFEKETGGSVTFGNNDKEHIIEKGMIGKHNYTKIKDVNMFKAWNITI